MRRALLSLALSLPVLATVAALPQSASNAAAQSAANSAPSAKAEPTPTEAELKEFVARQFGEHFTLAAAPGSKTVFLTGDFDGDGQEDAVLVAKCKDPIADQLAEHYKAVDPINTYYGWGRVTDTIQFGSGDADRARVLLVVYAWRSPTPKAKFVIINVPFTKLTIEHANFKKKPRMAILAEEEGRTTSSYLFWDGKHWRFEPGPGE